MVEVARRRVPVEDVPIHTPAATLLAELAYDQRDRMSELDVNPLMLREAGKGATAADATAHITYSGEGAGLHESISESNRDMPWSRSRAK